MLEKESIINAVRQQRWDIEYALTRWITPGNDFRESFASFYAQTRNSSRSCTHRHV